MYNDAIVVGMPSIRRVDGKSRLFALCQGIPDVDEIFFEVEEENEIFLNTEVADAFLLMLIEYAQLNGCDIRLTAPVTMELLDYVNEYYIPVLSYYVKSYKKITVIAPYVEDAVRKGTAIGTGFSAGVDSFYALYKQMDTNYNGLKLTHVLFANVGSQTYDYKESCEIFASKAARMKEIVAKVDASLGFISVNTNCLEIYQRNIGKGFTGPDARKTCSCVLALRNLFSAYFFSNGPTLDRFSFSAKDPAHFDLFSIDMMSKSGIQFYLRGVETPRRIDKLKLICDKKIVQETLSVCIDNNCGKCEKCVRTELELFAISKLDSFSNVFDVTSFKRKIVVILAKYLAIPEEHKLGFVREIEEEAKLHKVVLPRMAYVLSAVIFSPLHVLKQLAKNILRR